MKVKRSKINLTIPKNRLETLVDGIFAIAMTLLVLSIELPSIQFHSVTDFQIYIISLLPKIFIYFLSFILLAIFWMNHHIFFVIKRTNRTILWINIIWLMFIALIPFSTSLVSSFGQYQLSQIFFDLNIFAIGLLFYINWEYAVKRDYIAEEAVPYDNPIKKSNLFTPLIALAAVALSFINPHLSSAVFLAIPVIYLFYLKIVLVTEKT